MDPFHILNLKSDASIDEIKERFYKLTQLYHPDKGGNAAKYMNYKEAYQTILKESKTKPKEKTFSSVCAERAQPLKNLSAVKVTPKEFHRKFQEAEVHNDTGYTYNLARFEKEKGRVRVEKEFRKEYDTVSKNIEKVIPFTRSSFNSKDFNDTFVSRKKEHFKQNKQVEEIISEPEPVYLDSHYANNSASLENPQYIYGKDKYSPFNGAYNQHENPIDEEEELDSKEASNEKKKDDSNDELRKELAEMQKMIRKQEQLILRLVKKN